MGGTFGCVGTPLAPMPASDFILQLQNLYQPYSDLHFFSAPSIQDSSQLTAKHWLDLAVYVKELSQNFQKFIILHGTDTLSYASAFLHHLFGEQFNIVFTGSQYPLLDEQGKTLRSGSDAWDNFQFAYQCCKQNQFGVYLAFNGRLHPATSSYKQHTKNYAAFLSQGLEQASVAAIAEQLEIKNEHLQASQQIAVLNLYVYPTSAEILLQQLEQIKQGVPQILILQSFGSGNLPYSLALKNCLMKLLAQGCWVILSSQVLFGKLSQHYAAGCWLSELDLVIDPHHSQADLYARAVLLYLQYGDQKNWQRYWAI